MVLVAENPPPNAGDVRDLGSITGWEDPLEEGMATHCSILAWRIPWTEEPGRIQSIGSHRVRHDWWNLAHKVYYCFSVTQTCPTLWDPMDCSTPGFPVGSQDLELPQTHAHRVGDAIQPSHPLSPSCLQSFPVLRAFSNESALCIRWPKYWSFSFSIQG